MTPVEGVLRDLVGLFERQRIPYAVMGGLAVRAHGIPRPTYDVDVTIHVSRDRLATLFKEIEQLGYEIPPEYKSGWVDTVADMPLVKAQSFAEGRALVADIFLAETPFQRSLIERRLRQSINELETWLVTAEDLILLKLLAGRQRDLLDVADVVTMNLNLDENYLRKWAAKLKLSEQLERALRGQS